MDKQKWYSTTEVATILGTNKLQVGYLIRKGLIKAHNISAGQIRPRYRITEENIKNYIRSSHYGRANK